MARPYKATGVHLRECHGVVSRHLVMWAREWEMRRPDDEVQPRTCPSVITVPCPIPGSSWNWGDDSSASGTSSSCLSALHKVQGLVACGSARQRGASAIFAPVSRLYSAAVPLQPSCATLQLRDRHRYVLRVGRGCCWPHCSGQASQRDRAPWFTVHYIGRVT